jgi:hypothetical protein
MRSPRHEIGDSAGIVAGAECLRRTDISKGRAMDIERELAEQADLERRINEAGWHIVRDEQIPDGHRVEFQQGDPTEFHLKSAIRMVDGSDRNDAYRRFLEEIGVLQVQAGAQR